MKELIEKVVQWGVDRGLDKVGHLAQAKYTLKETAELLDAYADQDIEKINDAIGDILVTLIVGASNDENNLKSIFNFISDEDILIELTEPDSSVTSFSARYGSVVASAFNIIDNINYDDTVYYWAIGTLNNCLWSINNEFNQSLSLKDCLQLAYDEIKNRTGKMVNGQFIKDN